MEEDIVSLNLSWKELSIIGAFLKYMDDHPDIPISSTISDDIKMILFKISLLSFTYPIIDDNFLNDIAEDYDDEYEDDEEDE